MKKIRLFWPGILVIGLFISTRLFVWINRPLEFTEIIYSYMPYAHLWASGIKPYLQQWYEYPPITIPLFYLPHLIDRETFGQAFHLNYLQAYRLLLLSIDIGIFALIWRTLVIFKVQTKMRLLALAYYCLVTAKANHFLYDTMDLAFAGALALSVAPTLFKLPGAIPQKLRSFLAGLQNWLGYWLAVGLKLLNGPLGLPLVILERQQWRSRWLSMVIAGGLVWGIPIFLYRSSLSVMLVFHQMRGLQVDSFLATIVRIINSFTHSESIIEIYKNYEMSGPLTTQALKVLGIFFPLTLVIFCAGATWQAWRLAPQVKKHPLFRLSITLGFVLLLMIISKVLSRPFVLWHIPLLAMLPHKNWQQQLRFFLPSAIIVIVTLSAIPDVPVGIFSSAILVGVIRSLAFGWLFMEWARWHYRSFK